MEIRYGFNVTASGTDQEGGGRVKRYAHMLNSTLCALTRTICCILENYQGKRINEDGNEQQGVFVPEVLIPFMNGIDFLPFIKPSRENLNEKREQKTKQNQTQSGNEITPNASMKPFEPKVVIVSKKKNGTYTIGKDVYKTSVKQLIGMKFKSVNEFTSFINSIKNKNDS